MSTDNNYYEERLSQYRDTHQLALLISMALEGTPAATQQHLWASSLYMRLCIIGMSLNRLTDVRAVVDGDEIHTLDHSSIAAMARTLIEAAVLFGYMTEQGPSEEEWDLRWSVLLLHDATTRYKMFKSWKATDEAAVHKKRMSELRLEVSKHPRFRGLEEERRQKILAGTEFYIHGLRAAVRSVGWDVGHFNAIYAYLSSHSHSSPVSFVRAHTHGVDFEKPSGAQLVTAGLALEHAQIALATASERTLKLFPNETKKLPFANDILVKIAKEREKK